MNKVGGTTDFSGIFGSLFNFPYEYDPGKQVLKLSARHLALVFEVLLNDDRIAFDYLRDLTAKDQPPGRFHVVYNFLSFRHLHTLMVVAEVPPPDDGSLPEVESATRYWNSAEWLEREVYDMFGIRFKNHPDLRRVFLDETVSFFPLRKSFHVEKVANVADLNEIEEGFRKMAEQQKRTEEETTRKTSVSKTGEFSVDGTASTSEVET